MKCLFSHHLENWLRHPIPIDKGKHFFLNHPGGGEMTCAAPRCRDDRFSNFSHVSSEATALKRHSQVQTRIIKFREIEPIASIPPRSGSSGRSNPCGHFV